MSVGIRATYKPIVRSPIGQFIKNFPQETQAAFADVYPPTRESMLADLRHIPSRRFWTPEDWTSEKQRRAFWATDGFGGGIPHRRTNKIPAGWQVNETAQAKTITVEVKNTEPGAPYVYGSLAKSNPGKYRQRGHDKTGWPKGYEIVTFWLDALRDDLIDLLRERFGYAAAGKNTRRAFTRTRRR